MNLSDQCVKILRLALDEAAQPGEADAAAVKFIRCLRKDGIRPEDLFTPNTTHRGLTFGFGKHKGQPLDQVESSYITWALKTVERLTPAFRRELENELRRRKGQTQT